MLHILHSYILIRLKCKMIKFVVFLLLLSFLLSFFYIGSPFWTCTIMTFYNYLSFEAFGIFFILFLLSLLLSLLTTMCTSSLGLLFAIFLCLSSLWYITWMPNSRTVFFHLCPSNCICFFFFVFFFSIQMSFLFPCSTAWCPFRHKQFFSLFSGLFFWYIIIFISMKTA